MVLIALAELTVAAPPSEDYKLTWADEFDGAALDTSKWGYRLLGPRRDAINVTDAVSLDGAGNLVISTYTVGSGTSAEHHTGMIGTQGLFQQQYGYFEARINFDGAPGMWSAFWIQSPTMGNPIGDPGTAGAEIDVMEHRVYNGGGNPIGNVAHHALHWDGYGADHKSQHKDVLFPNLLDGYHLYALEWTPSFYRYYVDGVATWTISLGLSHRDEYLILSSEVEDGNWAGNIPGAGYGSLASTTTKMFVDYVRSYAVALLGDANNDLQVTDADLISVQQNFGNVGPVPLQGDANNDGQVTGADLISVQQNFGNVLGPVGGTVPEPAAAALLLVIGAPVLLLRRH